MGAPLDWALLARYLSDECAPAERAEVEARLAADPEAQRLVAALRPAWEAADPQSGRSDVDRLWGELAARTGLDAPGDAQGSAGRRGGWLRPRRLWRYAAVAALVVAAPLAYQQTRQKAEAPAATAAAWVVETVAAGDHQQQFHLGDGTRVRLDAGSTLRYPAAFAGDRRVVFLDGEGYFEVAPDPQRPFVVRAGQAVVTVLGTQFNVRAWRPEGRVAVAVAEGRVALGQDGDAGVEITGGQISVLPQHGPPTAPQAADIERHLGWMRREAIFDKTPLGEILYQLERWHGVRFDLADQAAAQERLTLRLQGASLASALELIAALTGLEHQRDGEQIRLRRVE